MGKFKDRRQERMERKKELKMLYKERKYQNKGDRYIGGNSFGDKLRDFVFGFVNNKYGNNDNNYKNVDSDYTADITTGFDSLPNENGGGFSKVKDVFNDITGTISGANKASNDMAKTSKTIRLIAIVAASLLLPIGLYKLLSNNKRKRR